MTELSYEETLALREPAFVDVRAPAEFAADHIPGAINIPVFDDGERALVGTLYRIRGKTPAIVKGTEIVAAKLSGIVERIAGMEGKDVVITCFRGGMRSTTLVSLLSAMGVRVYKLRDGYKGYRRFVASRIAALEIRPPAFVLHGLTGTGKTEILRRLHYAIDLEGMAGHRSSVFGGLGMRPNTQKFFESLLLRRVGELMDAPYTVMEGESRKIGDIHVPGRLMAKITASPGLHITAPIERRIDILLKEYLPFLDPGVVSGMLNSIEGKIGRRNVQLLDALLKQGDLREFSRLLLEKYYDPLYRHSLEKMEFIAEVVNEDAETAAAEVQALINGHLSGSKKERRIKPRATEF